MSREWSSVRFIVMIAFALPVVSAGSAAASECAMRAGQLTAMQTRYRATMAQLRSTQAEARQASQGDAEARLRTSRQLAATQREATGQRARMLEIYRGLVEESCEPFDAEGLRRTAEEFERLNADEQKHAAGVMLQRALRGP